MKIVLFFFFHFQYCWLLVSLLLCNTSSSVVFIKSFTLALLTKCLQNFKYSAFLNDIILYHMHYLILLKIHVF